MSKGQTDDRREAETQTLSISFRDGRSGQLRKAVLPFRPLAACQDEAEEAEVDLLMAVCWQRKYGR